MSSNKTTNKVVDTFTDVLLEAYVKRPDPRINEVKIELPIDSIEDVEVDVFVALKHWQYNGVKKYGISCEIESKHVYCGDCYNDIHLYGYSVTLDIIKTETIKTAVAEIIQRIQKLRFNNIKGEIVEGNEPKDDSEFYREWHDMLDGTKVNSAVQECCVCKEWTGYKTTCGHHTCFKCLSRLFKDKIGKEDKATCPLCREDAYPPTCHCS
jgi:hypothetical protein